MLLLIMLLISLSVLNRLHYIYNNVYHQLKTASNELKVRNGLPMFSRRKNRIIGDLGLPRRADTKNQRANTLVRRFHTIFTSCTHG